MTTHCSTSIIIHSEVLYLACLFIKFGKTICDDFVYSDHSCIMHDTGLWLWVWGGGGVPLLTSSYEVYKHMHTPHALHDMISMAGFKGVQ